MLPIFDFLHVWFKCYRHLLNWIYKNNWRTKQRKDCTVPNIVNVSINKWKYQNILDIDNFENWIYKNNWGRKQRREANYCKGKYLKGLHKIGFAKWLTKSTWVLTVQVLEKWIEKNNWGKYLKWFNRIGFAHCLTIEPKKYKCTSLFEKISLNIFVALSKEYKVLGAKICLTRSFSKKLALHKILAWWAALAVKRISRP